MHETKQTIDIKSALAETIAKQSAFDASNRFWYHGEIPLAIRSTAINSKVNIRRDRIEYYMRKNGWPVHIPWLTQLLLWHKEKGGVVKTAVIAFKYQLLDDCSRRGLVWDKKLDDHAEALAFQAIREHKERART